MSSQRSAKGARRRPTRDKPVEPPSEILWLAQVCGRAETLEGRTRATQELLFRVSGPLRDFVFRHTPEALAEDVHQETLLGIALDISRFHGVKESKLWAWCYRLARNKIADALRKQSRGGTPLPLDVEEAQRAIEREASHEAIPPGLRQDLDYALGLLRASKPPCADRLWDYYVLGLDYGEMAQLYELALDTVRMQIRRCLELAQTLVAKAD